MSATAQLKRLFRPAVWVGRRTIRKIDGWLRPMQKWNGNHHPAFEGFPPWSGPSESGFFRDFLGVKTSTRFRPQFREDPAGTVETRWPTPHAGYFEWAILLEAVQHAPGPAFRMQEWGAGFGPWLVSAHHAVRRLHGAGFPVHLTGVEMVPTHLEWMHEHFRNNGIDPTEHRLLAGAVSDRQGEGSYEPEQDCGARFGTQLQSSGTISVPIHRATDLLKGEDRIDLLHVDIQGEEAKAIPEAQAALRRQVRRLFIATHGPGIHDDLRRRLIADGWESVWDFGVRSRSRTEYGDMHFLDGVLVFRNPDG